MKTAPRRLNTDMNFMRHIAIFLVTLVLALPVCAQRAAETLATASGRTFTAQDLSPEAARLWTVLPEALDEARRTMLEEQIGRVLLGLEAAARKTTVEELVAAEVAARVPDPDDAEIRKIYEANRAQLAGVPLAEVRPQIVSFLRREPEKKAYGEFVVRLREKYKIAYGRDAGAPAPKPSDILVTVGGRPVTRADFIRENGLALYELEAEVYDKLRHALEQTVDSAVYASEAQSLGISTTDFIAREITDKLKDYSDEEVAQVEAELRQKLYPKYRVRFFLEEPEPFIQDISVDDDPSRGGKDARVTIVMFTDLQCPACASFYPVMKKVMNEYGDRVRLVVRDFPLKVHENAFEAAVAANAARAQGKFFEYKEKLYENQDLLDTDSLIKYAGELGLDVKRFAADLKSEELAAEVRKDIADGKSYGVRGTPSVFVNGYKLRHLSARSFREAIEKAFRR